MNVDGWFVIALKCFSSVEIEVIRCQTSAVAPHHAILSHGVLTHCNLQGAVLWLKMYLVSCSFLRKHPQPRTAAWVYFARTENVQHTKWYGMLREKLRCITQGDNRAAESCNQSFYFIHLIHDYSTVGSLVTHCHFIRQPNYMQS